MSPFLALAINGFFLIALLSMLQATLTLPGMAATMIFSFVISWNEVFAASVLTLPMNIAVAADAHLERKLARLISLDRLKTLSGLENLPLVQRGSRLSVMPVGAAEWAAILAMR